VVPIFLLGSHDVAEGPGIYVWRWWHTGALGHVACFTIQVKIVSS